MRIRWRQPGQVGDDNNPQGVGNGPPTVDGERVGSREIQIADSPQVRLRGGRFRVASSAVGPSLRQVRCAGTELEDRSTGSSTRSAARFSAKASCPIIVSSQDGTVTASQVRRETGALQPLADPRLECVSRRVSRPSTSARPDFIELRAALQAARAHE